LGNISSPVITRLGVNQFWYKHWFSDSNYKHNLDQDRVSETLIRFYLDYGITYSSNPIYNNYWYSNRFRSLKSNYSTTNMRFFRRFFYTNNIVGIEHSYLLRNHSGEYFALRLWVLKFLGWVVFSVQWFKPLKKKLKHSKFSSTKYKTNSSLNITGGGKNSSLQRLRLISKLFLKKLTVFKKSYCF